jgi:thiamine kinase-like enzyme
MQIQDSLIPQEKSAAVARALHETFGVTEFEDIRKMTKGNATTRVFRIVVRQRPYLLKIIMRTDDPTRHYANMRAAAGAGLAPVVRYTNIDDKTSITDFVETTPLAAADALVRIPATLRKLHALPPFAGVPHHINTTFMFLIHNGPARDGFLQKFQAANLLPKPESEEFFAQYARIAASYPHHEPDLVSSHNDLFKPDNILFDGDRIWLIDWEAAFLNDRYADLAVVANMIVTNDAEESAYLHAYFGQSPTGYQRARFFLARQMAHIFYTMGFLFLGSGGKPVDWSDRVPDYDDFRRRFWAGEVNLSDPAPKIVYAKVHWDRFFQNLRQPQFDEALTIVSAHNPS